MSVSSGRDSPMNYEAQRDFDYYHRHELSSGELNEQEFIDMSRGHMVEIQTPKSNWFVPEEGSDGGHGDEPDGSDLA